MNLAEEKNQELENIELWRRYQNDPTIELRNELVLLYTDLVRRIVLRFKGSYNGFGQMDDMVNQGMIALIDAVEKFNPDMGNKFETFATLKVRGSIIDFMRKQDWVPRNQRSLSKLLEDKYGELYADLGREPTNQELAESMEITEDNLQKIFQQRHNSIILSFEEAANEKMMEFSPLVERETRDERPESKLLFDELKHQLANSIDTLKEKERQVISLYYYENLKLKEIAEVLGVTESRISQIHSQAILKLKNNLNQY
ncbi:FliA/WhiG family RNA polymerase sigma factor [Eubacteriaceae bacterium ES3]|nr:FliA/WhiG family RNA polymerase sigma factor [Eubacteriaceae bacterium ES3]